MKYLSLLLLFSLACSSNTNESRTIVKPDRSIEASSNNSNWSKNGEITDASDENINEDFSIIAADFSEFIFQFGFNPDFQLSRIEFPLEYENMGNITYIPSTSWQHNSLFVNLEAVTEISNGKKVNEESSERVFSWINTKSLFSRNYYFEEEKGKWILKKISLVNDSKEPYKEDFIRFLGIFCKDSIFQKERVIFPLDMTYLDYDDYETIEESISKASWRFTRLYYSCDSIATIYYNLDRMIDDTDHRALIINGVENGINAQFTFQRINNKWFLVKYEDYST